MRELAFKFHYIAVFVLSTGTRRERSELFDRRSRELEARMSENTEDKIVHGQQRLKELFGMEMEKWLTDKLTTQAKGLKSEWVLKVYGYAGFDVKAFRNKIMSIGTSRDTFFMIFCFFMRGNNLDRLEMNTQSADVKARIEMLRLKYQLRSSAVRKTLNVSLGRLAISFPELVAILLLAMPDLPGPVSYDQICTISGMTDFPGIGRQSALACFLPKNHPDSMHILNVFMLSHLSVSEVINKRYENEWKWNECTPTQKFDKTSVYQLNAFHSNVFQCDQERIKWCRELGIMTGSSYSSTWMAAADKCKEKLEAVYKNSFKRSASAPAASTSTGCEANGEGQD